MVLQPLNFTPSLSCTEILLTDIQKIHYSVIICITKIGAAYYMATPNFLCCATIVISYNFTLYVNDMKK